MGSNALLVHCLAAVYLHAACCVAHSGRGWLCVLLHTEQIRLLCGFEVLLKQLLLPQSGHAGSLQAATISKKKTITYVSLSG